jgi:pimeloyl-ACP methyl ester carboxylesterase
MGKSDKPVMRYSTSEMAKDVIELLEHLQWASPRTLHIYGVSMGGMIAQELALLIPDRIASLFLVSTAARIQNTVSYVENLRNRINMFLPKSLDRSVSDAGASLFPDSWLDAPDDCILPTKETRGVILPRGPGGSDSPAGDYGRFETNFHRFAAQELSKRLDATAFTRTGFILQAIAAGWHHKSAAQLKELGDKVGRERICLLHGSEDRMITVQHADVLLRELQPGSSHVLVGSGHVFLMEKTGWHDGVVGEFVGRCEAIGRG